MGLMKKPHDKFFKAAFSDIETARGFLQHYLPEEVKRQINLATLETTQGSYVDKELRESHTDLLLRADIAGRKGYVYLLIEHKSYPHKSVILQLLKYMVKIWEKELQAGKKLSVIIPIVVYHGEERWGVEGRLSGLIEGYAGLPETLWKYIPDYAYELHDLTSEEEGEQIESGEVKMTVYLFRTVVAPDKGTLLRRFEEAMRALKEASGRRDIEYLIELGIKYLLSSKPEVELEELVEIASKISEERGEQIMTLAERLIDKGMQKGREEGLKEGLKEGLEKGLASGVEKGKTDVIWKLMIKKFPNLAIAYRDKIKQLDEGKLDVLALELLDMQKQEDLDRYLQT